LQTLNFIETVVTGFEVSTNFAGQQQWAMAMATFLQSKTLPKHSKDVFGFV
jgi:hypothetical protein